MREPAGSSKVGSEVGDPGGGSAGGGSGACREGTGGSPVGALSPGGSIWPTQKRERESLPSQVANEMEGTREKDSGSVAPGIWGIWSNPMH
jgi:hypothetical protein